MGQFTWHGCSCNATCFAMKGGRFRTMSKVSQSSGKVFQLLLLAKDSTWSFEMFVAKTTNNTTVMFNFVGFGVHLLGASFCNSVGHWSYIIYFYFVVNGDASRK